jgi:hypothetical protein
MLLRNPIPFLLSYGRGRPLLKVNRHNLLNLGGTNLAAS